MNEEAITSIIGKEEFLESTVVPSNASNQYVLWSSSDPAVASVDKNGNVMALSAGTCTITCTALDGGYTDTCNITVLDTPLLGTFASSADGLTDLGFMPNDVEISEDGQTAYMTETDSNRLYRVNLSTGEISYMEFIYKAEKLDISNEKIYLTLLHRDRDLGKEHNSGTIVSIDSDTFTYIENFNIEIDPYDIAVASNGYIFISPGNNEPNYLSSYNAGTGKFIDNKEVIFKQTIDYNESYDRLYTMYTATSDYMFSNKITNGAFDTEHNKFVEGYELKTPICISPDDKYIFNGNGYVFTCDGTDESDLLYFNEVEEFSSICFNIANNKFYTVFGKNLCTYIYDRQIMNQHFLATDDFIGVYYKNNQLIFLQKNDAGIYYFTGNPAANPDIILPEEILLDKNVINTMPNRTHKLTETILPENSSVTYLSGESSDPSVATVKNGIIETHSVGTCQITYTALNGGANAHCTVNVLATPETGTYISDNNAFNNIGFNPYDIEADTDREVVYLTEIGDSSRLYRVDTLTGVIRYMEFLYQVKRLTVINGKIYVLLLHEGATYDNLFAYATIAILDTETFVLNNSFDIDFKPYDIEADSQGYVYISPHSYDHDAEMVIYNSNTGIAVDSLQGMDYNHIFDYNDVHNKIYSLCTGLTPVDFDAYELENGIITSYYNSHYHGDYDFTRDLTVSPDGEYLFNQSGYILTCSPTQEGDLVYYDKIDSFDSVCFDVSSNAFYTVKDNVALTYDYTTRTVEQQFTADDNFTNIFHTVEQLIYLQKNSSDEYYFALNPVESASIIDVTGISLNKDSMYMLAEDSESLIAEVLPSNATNQHVKWTSSNPSVAVVDKNGRVTAVSTGTCEISATTIDGNYLGICIVTVLNTPTIGVYTTAINGLDNLGFIPYDVAVDPDKEVAYLTKENGYRLYRVDLSTGEVKYMEFSYQAKRFTVKNGSVYLLLSNGQLLNDIVIVIDTATFSEINFFKTIINSYDIEADSQGIVYIGPDYFSQSYLVSHNSLTGEQIDSRYIISFDRCLWAYNDQFNKLYTIVDWSSYIGAYEVEQGTITQTYRGEDNDLYLKGDFAVSPDGQFIFDERGQILTCAPTNAGDMVNDGNIDRFSSICFDLDNNIFYTAENNILLTYNYATRTVENQFTAEDDFAEIFYSNNRRIYLQKNLSDEYYFTYNPVISSTIIGVTDITIDNSIINMMSGDIKILTSTILPSDATNQHILWISSDPSVASVEDGIVTANSVGSCSISVTTLDGGYTAECEVNVLATPLLGTFATTIDGFSNLGFTPFDTQIDYTNNAAYLTNKEDSRLYRVDLATGEVVFMDFIYRTSRIDLANGKVYLTLSYIDTDNEETGGIIAVIDTGSLTLINFFNINYYPYDIVADSQETVYVSSYYGQIARLSSYRSNTGELLSYTNNVRNNSLIEYNKKYNKLYVTLTEGSPDELVSYEIEDGAITSFYYWSVDDYDISSYQKISPDGQIIYNGAGNFFTCASEQKNDMRYYGNIDSFSSICFGVDNNAFYTVKDNIALTYNSDTQMVANQFTAENNFTEVFYINSQLLYIQKNDSNEYFFTYSPTKSDSIVNVTGISLNKDYTHIRMGDTETLTAEILPVDATNKYVKWISSDPLIATIDNRGKVTAISIGTCEITAVTIDGDYTKLCTVNVLDSPVIGVFTTAINGLVDLEFVPFDVVVDPDRSVAYMTEVNGYRLYRVDLLTGEVQYMEFVFKAEMLTVKNGKVYVTLLHRPHDIYYVEDAGSGTIVVVGTADFLSTYFFDVSLDPYDIAVNSDGIIYTGSGSGQSSIVASYDSSTGNFLNSIPTLIDRSRWYYNDEYSKLYGLSVSRRRNIYAYDISYGLLTEPYYASPYYDEYYISMNLSISPDGQYIFNGSGNIFICAPTRTGDMIYNGNIDSFSSICFDLDNNKFYTTEGSLLRIYEYDSRTITKQFINANEFINIFCVAEGLAALKKTEADIYYIDPTVTEFDVSGISIDEEVLLYVGNTVKLVPVITPGNATNKNVIYSTNNELVAKVDATGIVTACSEGEVIITVTTEDGGFTDTCVVTVVEPVTSVDLSPSTIQINLGSTSNLTATVSPANATNKNVFYSSSNESIALVDTNGLVTGISTGNAIVTVTTEDGGHTDTCTVTVTKSVTSITLSPSTLQVNAGSTSNLTATVYPADSTNKNVSYSSSNDDIATVDAIGTVWAHSQGTAIITVTTEDGGYTVACTVTVVQPVTGVELSRESASIYTNDTLQLTAAVSPEDATNQNINYSSNNEAVATVNASGLVTAHSEGTAIITATTEDGGYTDTCEITVTNALIVSDIYTANRVKGYLEDIAIGSTAQDIIDAINNSSGEIRVYDPNMQQITGNVLVSTGYIVQLIVDGDVVDELTIAIKGDLSPDGILDVIDYTLIRLHILNVMPLTGIGLDVADVNNDGVIDVIDYTLVRLHILGVMPL